MATIIRIQRNSLIRATLSQIFGQIVAFDVTTLPLAEDPMTFSNGVQFVSRSNLADDAIS